MTLSAEVRDSLLTTLQARFERYAQRHSGLDWAPIQAKLTAQPDKLAALHAMERTGGEPDVIAYDAAADEYLFVDCSTESPSGRRSLCFDPQSLDERKENKPAGSAVGMAEAFGITLLTEAEYRRLQQVGEFDTKTSSWIQTPATIRRLGGALFMDRRYDSVFVYHNGAQSYYAARGFRGALRV